MQCPELFLDPSTSEIYLRGVSEAAPTIAVLFSGFQRLVHIFEADHTPAAYILCTLFKGYEASSLQASNSICGHPDIVKLLFSNIFSRFLNGPEGNLYRLLCLATPEGRLLYRTKFMAERREFQIEPPCPYQLELAVEIEEKTLTAIRIVNDHA
jgi:hypothetical protein